VARPVTTEFDVPAGAGAAATGTGNPELAAEVKQAAQNRPARPVFKSGEGRAILEDVKRAFSDSKNVDLSTVHQFTA
jgi:hypothetical protein